MSAAKSHRRRISRVLSPSGGELLEMPGSDSASNPERMQPIYETQGPRKAARRVSRVSVTSGEGDAGEGAVYEQGPVRARRTSRVSVTSGESEGEGETARKGRRVSRISVTQPISEEDLQGGRRKSRQERASRGTLQALQSTSMVIGQSQGQSQGQGSETKAVKRSESHEPQSHFEFSYSKAVYDYVRAHGPPRRRKHALLNPPGKNVPSFVPDVTLHHVHKIELFHLPEEATFIWESTGAPNWSYQPRLFCPPPTLPEEGRRGRHSPSKRGGVTPEVTRRSRRSNSVQIEEKIEERTEEESPCRETRRESDPSGASRKRDRSKPRVSLPAIPMETNMVAMATQSLTAESQDVIVNEVNEAADKLDEMAGEVGGETAEENHNKTKNRRKKMAKDVKFNLTALQCEPLPDVTYPESLQSQKKGKEKDSDPFRGNKGLKLPKLP